MIFVTVGTHEQPFDRLIKYIDNLKCNGAIKEEVVIQTGFSLYKPRYCDWSKLYTYQEMKEKVSEARIVITHGGPASFIMPLQLGKTPIVVPRRQEYGEHVNNHQIEFAKAVENRYHNILVVEDIDGLNDVIKNYERYIKNIDTTLESNNIMFNEKFCEIVNEVFERNHLK